MFACRSGVHGNVARAARALLSLAMIVCASLLLTPSLHAQVTTGSIAGSVVTDADNSALPGVTVEAVHVPTGTHYQTVSGVNGRYEIANVRPGGPYRLTASLEGFKPTTVNGVQIGLGTTADIPIRMKVAAVTETVTVTARPDEVINPNHTGSATAVSTREIQTLPTVNRSLQDFARTNPYFDVSPTDSSGTLLNVAGRNNRYNNIQIDGAVNNDLFGLASTGTPGGQTGSQPIPLDSLQELQLVVSPYDVRQSGFTGGGINAVTRSGTNKFEGSAFGTKRSKSYIGNGPLDKPVSSFNQTQWGGRFGGPIISDKLFFFVSGEENRKGQPNGTSADGSTGTVYQFDPAAPTGKQPDMNLLSAFLKSKYNYDPGSLGDLLFHTNSNLMFGRLDYNLNNSNNITLRHNYVDGVSDVGPSSYSRTSSRFYFPTSIYTIADKTNSTVAQVNSVFGPNMFNEGRVGYQTIRDVRSIPVVFPTVEIGGSGERNGAVQVGTERFSGANYLNQNITEFTDDFTWVKGGHTLVFGTHDESFSFKNLFIQDAFGYYYFPTLDAFEQNKPTIYKVGFATGNDPLRPAAFRAGQYSLYANDQWRVNNNLTLTFGLRADKPHFGSIPNFNPLVQTGIGYSTATVPDQKLIWEPRVGFNWDPFADGKQQLRGGIGVFQGRAPYVWISNAYSNTGVDIVSLGCTPPACTPPAFNPDPTQQPRNLGAGAVPSIALTDPNFQFPRVLRTTLGYDRELWWGIRGTAEVLYSKTQQDIFYTNVNYHQVGNSPLDGRPVYSKVAPTLGDAILLTNTGIGHELTETLQLNKTFRNLTLTANYAHQNAASAFDGTSSIAYSNWQFQPNAGDITTPQLAPSSFEVKNRFNLAATYNFVTGPFSHGVGLYYDAESGNPYSLLMGGDINKDGTANDDLLFVPAQSTGIILCPSSAKTPTASAPCGTGVSPIDSSRFYNFLSSAGVDVSKGQVLPRNKLYQPWVRRLDFHYELGLPQWRSTRVMLTADVLNLLNMFDKNWGVAEFVSFGTYTPVNAVTDSSGKPVIVNGQPVYKEAATNRLNPNNQFSIADTSSRWQGRLGIRVNF